MRNPTLPLGTLVKHQAIAWEPTRTAACEPHAARLHPRNIHITAISKVAVCLAVPAHPFLIQY
jgi:hypothetical protein